MHWGLAVSKLRWTLLILGGVFILALALWELLRPRQARGANRREATQEAWVCEPLDHDAANGTGEPGPAAVDDRSDDPTEQPRSDGEGVRAGSVPGEEFATVPTAEGHSRGDVSTGEPSNDGIGPDFPGGLRADPAEPWIGEPGLAEAASPASGPRAGRDSRRVVISSNPDESPTSELPVLAEAAVDVPAPQALEETVAIEGLASAEPIVRWPPESLRQIVALRLVAPPERFPGRAVRLALGAEGFLPGKFDIFHKPDRGHRAVVSAASLTRPGTFDLDTMDSQRIPGLSLFVVLPGPHPGEQAFDELVDVAQNLCERLQGELQDAQGEVLTEESIRMLRAALPASAGGGAVS